MEPCKYKYTPMDKKSMGVFLYPFSYLVFRNYVKIVKKIYNYKDKCNIKNNYSFIEEVLKMLKVTLKDGAILEVEKGSSIFEVAKQISEGLARNATCGEVDGEVKDLRYELQKDCNLVIHTFQEEDLEGKKAYWHTTSHIMAQAVKRLFPDAKLAIGPSIEEGFYYDFDVEKPFTDEDKAKIEEEMKKIIKEDIKIERFSLPKKEAL